MMRSGSRLAVLAVPLLFIAGCVLGPYQPAAANGGRAVVLIHDIYELQDMRLQGSAHFELANDIDASVTRQWNAGAGFVPIGNDSAGFNGRLDGKGHNITNLFIYRPSEDWVGLIGRGDTDPEGLVRDLNLVNVDITGGNRTGGLAGNCTPSNCHVTGRVSGGRMVGGVLGGFGGIISNCSFKGIVKGTGEHVGGLAGYGVGLAVDCFTAGQVIGTEKVGGLFGDRVDGRGKLSRCASSASVEGTNNVGGLVGYSIDNISECYSLGKVTGTEDVGGLVGNIQSIGSVVDCYSHANVTGVRRVGGLAGSKSWHPPYYKYYSGDLSRCYSAGAVSGQNDTGALVGRAENENSSDCFWDRSISQIGSSAAGIGKETSDMMKKSTFANWDFENVWAIDENRTYPYFRKAPVLPTNLAPVITSSPVRTALAGTLYSVQFSAYDADNDPLDWNLTTNASWLNLSGSGLLSGTPSESDLGPCSVTVTVSDGKNGTDDRSFELSVVLNRAPQIASASGPDGTTVPANKALTFSVEATDPDGDSLTYDWQENGSSLSRERSFSRKFPPGNHTLILLIGDGRYTTTRTFNFTVAPAPKTIDIKPASLPGFQAGIAAAAVVVVVTAGLFWRRERR